MTDERDPEFSEPVSQRISQSYRELGAEEPPRALDDEILAAARREAGARPATLAAQAAQAARSGRQRWYAPLAAAAVLVLAVAVTLNMQVERPGIESPVQQAPPRSAAREAANEVAKPATADEVKVARRKAAEQPAPSVAAAPSVPVAPEPKPFASDRAAASTSARSDESRGTASSVTGTLARQAEERTSRDAEAAAPALRVGPVQALAKRSEMEFAAKPAAAPPPPVAAKSMSFRERPVELTPERELERVAELRGQGRHDEADKALAEFRKRHPDYKISGAMLERVERR